MTKFKDQPGNKGLPEPREGYQQCKVIHRKYNEAIQRGWVKRLDNPWSDTDFVLCERRTKDLTYDNIIEAIKESLEHFEEKDTVEIINSFPCAQLLQEGSTVLRGTHIPVAKPTKKKGAN